MLIRRAVDLFLEGYFSTNDRSEKTILAYTTDLAQFCDFLPGRQRLETLEAEDFEEWAAHLKKKGYAGSSIRRKFAAVRVFLNYWVRRRVLDFSPLTHVRLQLQVERTLPRVLTQEELRTFLGYARSQMSRVDFIACRDTVIVEILVSTAARVGEVVQLRTHDYDPGSGQLLIRGKGRRERIVFVHDALSQGHLGTYLNLRAELHPIHDNLLLSPSGRPLSSQGAARVVTRTAADAGISFRVTPHRLRHTTASLLLNNGADIRTVQELLGHTSILTTQRYTQVTKGQLLRSLRRHHPMNEFPGGI